MEITGISDLKNNRQIPPQTAATCSFCLGGRNFFYVHFLLLFLLISDWLIWPGWVLAVPVIADTPSALSLTAREKQWLFQHSDEISLWYDEGFSPFEFSDEHNQFVGMGADIVAMVEKKLGITIPNKVSRDWNTSLTGLKNGQCSLVPAIVPRSERAEHVLFTRPYARVPVVIITRQNTGYGRTLDDLSRRKIAVVSGYATEEYLRSHRGNSFEILSVESVAGGLRAVAFGVADAFVGDLATASFNIDSLGITSLQVAGVTDYNFQFCIGVSKQYPLLFSSIEKAMDDISGDELALLQKKWITLKDRQGMSPETMRFLKVSALFTLMLIIGLAVITIVLKRSLNSKIVRLKEAQEEIARSEDRFRTFFENAPIPLVEITREGNEIFLNKSFSSTFGYETQDLPSIDAWWTLAYPDPDYRQKVQRHWDQSLDRREQEGNFFKKVQYGITCKNGDVLHVIISRSMVDKRILAGFLDVTELTRSQAELKKSMERFQAGEEKMRVTLNSIGDGVITTDTTGHVTQMNPVAQSLTGWCESEAMGRELSEVFQIVDQGGNLVENPVPRVIFSGQLVGLANHTTLVCRDGTRYDIADSGAPIRDKTGEIIGVVLVFRDVTREYALERQLRQSQKMEAIGTLAGGIAHDFNNILSAQMGFTDLARMSANGNGKLLRYLDRVTSASLRARDLVRQILTFSRKDEVKKGLINIRPLILEAIEFIRASLPAHIDLRYSLIQGKSLVFGDPTQLHQIFMNLFTNAAHAMGAKGGTIEVSMAKTVKHEDEMTQEVLPGNYLEITVSDAGSGIPREMMDRIFEPFFTTKVRGQGTGMGLSTVYGILKDMGGTIEVSSQEDVGTTFTMLLPEQKGSH